MQVRIGSTLSDPRNINGGSPQGSILGNYLFCITTDRLEQGIDYRGAVKDRNGNLDASVSLEACDHHDDQAESEEVADPTDPLGIRTMAQRMTDNGEPGPGWPNGPDLNRACYHVTIS